MSRTAKAERRPRDERLGFCPNKAAMALIERRRSVFFDKLVNSAALNDLHDDSQAEAQQPGRKNYSRYPLVGCTLNERRAVGKHQKGRRLGSILPADALRRVRRPRRCRTLNGDRRRTERGYGQLLCCSELRRAGSQRVVPPKQQFAASLKNKTIKDASVHLPAAILPTAARETDVSSC
jgi:hypothetical protein